MRIHRISEAKYGNFQRGSFQWVLNKFFDDQHETDPNTDVFKIKPDFLAIYYNQHIVDLIEISRDGTVYLYPLIGNAKQHHPRAGSLADQLIIFRKDRVHPQ